MRKITDFFRRLFIPHEQNNFRANALHIDFLTYYLIFAIFLSFGFSKLIRFADILGFATDISVDKLYQLTNQQRTNLGLSPLTYNQELANAAAAKAQDMFAKNYWSHYGPNGETPWNFILNSGYRYEYAGENLAKNFMFSQGVMDTWMNSSTHRENIVKSNYTDVGYAVVNGVLNGEQTTLVVQMFGKPLLSAPVAQKNTIPIPAAPVKAAPETVKQTVTLPQTAPAPAILAKESAQPKINLFTLSFDMNVIFLSFLILAIVLDFYFAAKMNIIRIGGKNLAHFIFIGFILIGIIFVATKGTIL